MINFVFHHSGYDRELPSMLVKSLLKTNHGSSIIQVSDQHTKAVDGITEFKQFTSVEKIYSKQRCEMYAKLDIKGPTIYLDTDMLVIKPITESEIFDISDVVLCQRFWDGTIHSTDPNDTMYTFRNQSLKEVWPYVACFVACHNNLFWQDVYDTVQTFSEEKSDWFADQHALKILGANAGCVSEQQYGCLPDQDESPINSASILHFKGSRKNIMKNYYHYLLC